MRRGMTTTTTGVGPGRGAAAASFTVIGRGAAAATAAATPAGAAAQIARGTYLSRLYLQVEERQAARPPAPPRSRAPPLSEHW